MTPLVEATGIVRTYGAHEDEVRAVDGVSLTIERGETVGLVGESGSGKSTLASILLAIERPTAGSVRFDGRDLLTLSGGELRAMRRRMQMVFQDPVGALNRRKTIEHSIGLPLAVHGGASKAERTRRVHELLDLVGLSPAHAKRLPRELSGGQCQRVGIARAIALEPELVVLDEAVSSVDVSVQAQILNLLRELQGRLGLTYLFVSHDLAVVRYMASRVAVMHHGRLVEEGTREEVFAAPRDAYTRSLLAAIPLPDPDRPRLPGAEDAVSAVGGAAGAAGTGGGGAS